MRSRQEVLINGDTLPDPNLTRGIPRKLSLFLDSISEKSPACVLWHELQIFPPKKNKNKNKKNFCCLDNTLFGYVIWFSLSDLVFLVLPRKPRSTGRRLNLAL